MKKIIFYLSLLFSNVILLSQNKYQKDFELFWNIMAEEYAYFDGKETDWVKVKEIYEPQINKVTKGWEFVQIIESIKYELYDSHFGLNKNLPSSFRLLPGGTDAWVEYKSGKYFIVDLRNNYQITNSGIDVGSELLSVNNKEIDDLVAENIPKSLNKVTDEVKEYLANLIFAGRHNEPRKIKVKFKEVIKVVELSKSQPIDYYDGMLSSKLLEGNIGYVRINNSLGNNNLIEEFQNTVDVFKKTKAIILDLRDTPSGGNTTVAKSIMGKFVTESMPYQIHELVSEERVFGVKRKFIELLYPMKNPYKKPVYVLVGRWTGSVGEAIAQGFSTIKTAKVIGTEMAKLLGAIRCEILPETKLSICFPFEKLYHVNGTPREEFIPEVQTKSSNETFQKVIQLINE